MSSDPDRPLAQIRLHPALIVLGCFYVAIIGRRVWPLELGATPKVGLRALGFGLIALALVTLSLSYNEMARAQTTINPRVHSTALVTSGMYRFSRNPIYTGWFLLTLGIGLVTQSLFPIGIAFLMIALLHRAVVIKEEAYLEKVFGDEYRRYRASVRRWL